MILASPPLDFEVHDSYFVVAHFHYVVFGTVVYAMFAGFYFWWPKFTGRMLDERLGKIHFWTLFIGFHTTFLVHHWLGVIGMPRRYVDYLAADGFTTLNTVSTIGSFLLGLSTLPFIYNVWKTGKYGKRVELDDPWGWGRSLEWATSCPRPATTSSPCRRSAPNPPPSTSTTPRSSPTRSPPPADRPSPRPRAPRWTSVPRTTAPAAARAPQRATTPRAARTDPGRAPRPLLAALGAAGIPLYVLRTARRPPPLRA
ncbi:hypothetical protein SVIO_043110 [Streptomyces violaceusniger]|uniref:Cytochrome oxidase subunit I profile domain-containing protein n=1 Tax=Streptomyces violaceusniger TaxID=68280 RepID=A0A4D4L544_STRVO|nr:hypothetical protein SVIO_043110 [Streptomyces violaceusniger]